MPYAAPPPVHARDAVARGNGHARAARDTGRCEENEARSPTVEGANATAGIRIPDPRRISRPERRSGFGRGLDARVVLEELLVQLGEVLPVRGHFVFREDRLPRADRLAGAPVGALIRVDVEHVLALVDADPGGALVAG